LTWLQSSISMLFLDLVIGCKNSFQLWEMIHSHFHSQTKANVRKLQTKPRNKKKGDPSIEVVAYLLILFIVVAMFIVVEAIEVIMMVVMDTILLIVKFAINMAILHHTTIITLIQIILVNFMPLIYDLPLHHITIQTWSLNRCSNRNLHTLKVNHNIIWQKIQILHLLFLPIHLLLLNNLKIGSLFISFTSYYFWSLTISWKQSLLQQMPMFF